MYRVYKNYCNFTDAGWNAVTAERYVNSDREKKHILDDHRKLLLDNLHKCRKHIDSLGYLIHRKEEKRLTYGK